MKKKIVGIFVMTLLIATTLPIVTAINNYNTDFMSKEGKTYDNNYLGYVNNMGSPPDIIVTDPPFGIIKVVNSPDVYVSGYVTDDLGIDGFGYIIKYADGTAVGPYNSIYPPDKYYTFEIHENIKLGSNYLTIEVSDVDGNQATKDITLLYINVRNKFFNKPFLTFLENHPHLFPLIRQILGV